MRPAGRIEASGSDVVLVLSDAQIERYSRQIVLPQVGGRGQERLLAARLAIAGELADLESSLPYIVGAGVGTIFLNAPGDSAQRDYLIAQMRELNRDVNVSAASSGLPEHELTLILIGSARARDTAAVVNSELGAGGIIAARLDRPGRITIVPSRPPCLACVGEALTTFGARSETAEPIAMVAATEALKHLISPIAEAAIVEFSGLTTSAAAAASGRPDCPSCAPCSRSDARRPV